MSQITYADKSAINENPGVADINKVKATDMNEIKTAVNDNDTRIENITGTILWTNSNPNSSFPTQNITLSSSDYDCYEIIYMFSTTNTNCSSTGKIPKGKGTMLVFIINITGVHGNTTRSVNYSSDTQLEFESTITEAGGISDNRCIPLYIIGYKTGVFN